MKKLRVGIIGIAPGRSWASIAIVPALRALPDYELVAVSTRRMESAMAAAKGLGISLAFDNHHALVTHPDVDFIVVAVRVPSHFDLVPAALETGKPVYCEWPLANGVSQGESLTALAKRKGGRAFCGLQLRAAPFVQYVRDLIAQGYVGKVLSTSVTSSGLLCGAEVPAEYEYTLDRSNGANMLTVNFGHLIDTVLYTLQEDIASLSATTATLRRSVQVLETGATIPMSSEDQVAVSGILSSEAVFSVHLWGGPSRAEDPAFQWRIQGTEGDLKLTASGIAIQVTDVTIHGARKDEPMRVLAVPEKYKFIRGAEGPAQYVAQTLSRVATDIREGTSTSPTFEDALRRLRLIAAIQESARTGRRQRLES